MSRLVTLDPDIKLTREPDGYQFGKQVESESSVTSKETKIVSLAPMAPAPKMEKSMDPIPDKDVLNWGISPEEIIQRQTKDKFCQNIKKRILKEEPKLVYPYYVEDDLLM